MAYELASLGCGCRITADGHEMHIYPCRAQHEPHLSAAAREVLAEMVGEMAVVDEP